VPDFEGWKGKISLFMIVQALNVIGAFMEIVKLFGWKPTDDAPELP
jgi:hypothetical protein